mmetsp:Transcript_28779/g.76564  ORF Transcript_28779/g.76564 Transcript_28779/m.76564 type:complete len:201 (-) Transcript_28779:627-1229(-)
MPPHSRLALGIARSVHGQARGCAWKFATPGIMSKEPVSCQRTDPYHRAASNRRKDTTSGNEAESHAKLMNPQLLTSSGEELSFSSSPSVPLVVVALGHISSSWASSSVVKSGTSPLPPRRMPPPHWLGCSMAHLNKGYMAHIISICPSVRSSGPTSPTSVVLSGSNACVVPTPPGKAVVVPTPPGKSEAVSKADTNAPVS